MNLSKEEALRLHRKMWSDMQKEFGDCWIRYKMFENCVESAKPIIGAEK